MPKGAVLQVYQKIFNVENFEMVYPWVLAGQPLTKVLLNNEQAIS